ncbi:MAG: tetratricopeptide repeat protein [Planctomycetia bacterium]|nr:tetratricopeptide repeat protein [Planctomycetia bacterium]
MKSIKHIRLYKLCREAEGYLELGLPKLAISTLTRLDDKTIRRYPRLLLLKGEALRQLHLFQSAIICFRELNRKKEFALLHSLIASCYKNLGQFDKAALSMKRALELEPNSGIHHFNLACYYSLLGYKYRTLEELSTAVDLDRNIGKLIKSVPDFDSLRNDPDFIQTVQTIAS